MINGFQLTVENVLTRPLFQNTRVIAGHNGLMKQVKWTHIVETDQFESLINGGELILTTGADLKLDSSAGLDSARKLISKNAVGICLEIGTKIDHVSSEIIALANEHDFPIILFDEVVKFVDITQDLHTLIINHHHQMLSHLNTLSMRFNEYSLFPNGILKILQELHSCFKKNALFIADNRKPYYYPPETRQLDEVIRLRLEAYEAVLEKQEIIQVEDEKVFLLPVKSLGQLWGHLCVTVNDDSLDEFFYSVIDRAALSIAQIMLRSRTIEERKQNAEDSIVRNLLNGKAAELEEVQSVLPPPAKNLFFRTLLINTARASQNAEEEWEETKLQQAMLVRSLFKRHGFFPAISVRKSEIAVISSFISKESSSKETKRFCYAIKAIQELLESHVLEGSHCSFSVSNVQTDFDLIKKSYEEAKEVLELQEAGIADALFYENIGIYRLLLLLRNSGQLGSYIEDYLGPLLNYDQTNQTELFETLEVFLECGGSKKEAAERLFIVRQTLYHRLEKIRQLLGNEFMEPMNRLALESAMKALYLWKENPYRR